MRRLLFHAVCLCAVTVFPLLSATAQTPVQSRYLLFQIFTYSPKADDHAAAVFPPAGVLDSQVQDIVSRIGSTGRPENKLGFAVGPLTFNHSDDEIRGIIRDSFRIARAKNMAVAFHIDNEKFWCLNKSLASTSKNFEWLDWKGTVCSGRRLDWSKTPAKVDPQMCLKQLSCAGAVVSVI